MDPKSALHFTLLNVSESADDVRALIYDNLYEPWGVTREKNWLNSEDGGAFLVARDGEGTLLGVARIMPIDAVSTEHKTPPECAGERMLRQVVVAVDARGKGIGRALMAQAEAIARSEGATRVGLGSRCQAYGFYQACGYEFYGEEYMSLLTRIPHTHMSKILSPPEHS